MDKLEVKQKLEQIRSLERYIKSCEEELEVLNSRTMRITNYSGMSRGGGDTGIEELYERIASKANQLTRAINNKETLIVWLNSMAATIDYDEYAIIRYRYVMGYSLIKVARLCNYSYDRIRHKVDEIIGYVAKTA